MSVSSGYSSFRVDDGPLLDVYWGPGPFGMFGFGINLSWSRAMTNNVCQFCQFKSFMGPELRTLTGLWLFFVPLSFLCSVSRFIMFEILLTWSVNRTQPYGVHT